MVAFRHNLVALGIADGNGDDDGGGGGCSTGGDGDGNHDIDGDGEGPAMEEGCPPAVQLLLDVIDRCCHFLPIPDASVQVMVVVTTL